jgi:hypothetical protein
VWVKQHPRAAKAIVDAPIVAGSLLAIVVGFWLIAPSAGLIVGGLMGLGAVAGRKTLSVMLRAGK